ncbi:MAG: tRNA 2-thiouridine(34) synthase MnmA, partial [Geminicoccaceae bacterium]
MTTSLQSVPPGPAGRPIDLGFAAPNAASRVVVAMSGGVDSSCVAAILAEAGYDVIGVTLQLYDHGQAVGKKGACCAGQDIQDAKNVADQLGIPHYVLDFEQRFKDAVIEDFAQSYADGITPVPCIRCNQRVKFRDLLDIARDLGADALATGHYVRRVVNDGVAELRVAVDAHRDQSYFLFATTQEQLDYLRFPLGDLEKTEVRNIAERFGLVVADKPDSQDICFVPNGSYANIVEKLRPGAAEPGDIVHVDGRVLGRHEGLIHYTVGQRRGLAVAVGEPLYVVRLEPKHHRLIVGPRIASLCAKIELNDFNDLAGPAGLACAGDEGLKVQVKHRAREPAVDATVRLNNGISEVEFEKPQTGVAPGQACVVYQGLRILGGGWIKQAPLIADKAPSIPEVKPVIADDLDDFAGRRYMAL